MPLQLSSVSGWTRREHRVGVETLADSQGQGLRRERLREKPHSLRLPLLFGEQRVRESRDVAYLDRRSLPDDPLREVRTAQHRHDDIAQEQIDGTVVGFCNGYRVEDVTCLQHAVSVRFECL